MDSYSLGTEYGTDQINVNSHAFPDLLRQSDHNDFHQINKIKNRELRLQEKINMYKKEQLGHCNSANISTAPNISAVMAPRYFIEGASYKRAPQKNKHESAPATVCDGCSSNRLPDNVDMLKNEIVNLEKKNNTLIFLLCVLVVIILTQYSKSGGITYMYPQYQTAAIHPASIPSPMP